MVRLCFFLLIFHKFSALKGTNFYILFVKHPIGFLNAVDEFNNVEARRRFQNYHDMLLPHYYLLRNKFLLKIIMLRIIQQRHVTYLYYIVLNAHLDVTSLSI